MKNTFTHPSDFWQERDFGAKISATFEFIGVHWRPLGRVLLYLAVPLALFQGIVAAALQTQLVRAVQHSSPGGGGVSFRYATYLTALQSPAYFLNSIVSTLLHTVLILSVYGYLMRCVYAEQPGAPVTVPEVWAVVKRKVVGTYFSLFGVWLLIAFGFLLFVLPGMYLAVVLSLYFVVSVFENSDFASTISRCLALVRGNWWSTFGLLLVMLLLIYLVLASVGVVLLLAGGLKALLASSAHGLPPSVLVVFSSVGGLFSVLLYVPILLALAFQYFNLVERKEGLGLRLLVDKLGDTQAASAAQSSHYQPDQEGEY